MIADLREILAIADAGNFAVPAFNVSNMETVVGVMQAAQEETPVVENATDDAELLAVIAAALASFDNSNKLIVRSVRRVSGWKNANRAEQVSRF